MKEPTKAGWTFRIALVFWLGAVLITPFLIPAFARGKANGSEIGAMVAWCGAGVLFISSLLLSKTGRLVRNPMHGGLAAMLLFVLGIAVGLGLFFVACSMELGRSLGHQ